MMNRKWLAVAALTGVMALAFSGCGGGGGGDAGPAKPKRDWQPTASVKYGSRTADVYEIKTEFTGTVHNVAPFNMVLDGDTVYTTANGQRKNKATYLLSAKLVKGALTDPKMVSDTVINSKDMFHMVGKDFYFQKKNIAYYDGKETHDTKLKHADLYHLCPTGSGNEVIIEVPTVNDTLKPYKVQLDKGELKDKKLLCEIDYSDKDGKLLPNAFYAADKDHLYVGLWDKPQSKNPTRMKLVEFDQAGKEVRSYPGYGTATTLVEVTDNYVVMGAPADKGAGLKVYNKKDGKEVGEVKLDFLPKVMHKTGTDSLFMYSQKTKNMYVVDL